MKTGVVHTLVFVRFNAQTKALCEEERRLNVQGIESMTDQMMAILFVLCGLYCAGLYALRGKAEAMKKAKLLYPRGCAPEQCRDLPGYLKALMPRVLVLGVGLIAFGAAGLIFSQGTLAALLLLILPLCLLAWFVRAQRGLAEKYWKKR